MAGFEGVDGFAAHDTPTPVGSGYWLWGDDESGGGLILGVFFGGGAGLGCRPFFAFFASFGNHTMGDAARLLYQNHKQVKWNKRTSKSRVTWK